MSGEKGLFEAVIETAGFTYISDLRHRPNGAKLLGALDTTKAESYALCEWEELYSYLAGEKRKFSSEGEARAAVKAIAEALGTSEQA